MTDRTRIIELTRVLPPTHGADERVDWAAAEERWGTPFPKDYVEFMSLYGGGSFDEVCILTPLPVDYTRVDPGSFEDETEQARYMWEMEGGPDVLDVDPDDILAWGVTSGADVLCWLTTDPDPDQWPVLVCNPDFTIYHCGMVEFLLCLFREDIEPYPIGIDVRDPATTWIHWKEEERRHKAGLSSL
ncbi:SMI1/KNR4 family protein [Kitasatospora sp. NPDC058965]|uniref:SMI1/KNR4 family protein n=1 Tax=Kitasatospora sp. NPDC058965 TaxID=3346682 RepID=UPI0036B8D4C0